MERREEYGERNERQPGDLERIRNEAFLELTEYDVKNQLIDATTEAEHWRCVNYIKTRHNELCVELPWSEGWEQTVIDGNEPATVALIAANFYRFEKDFQTMMMDKAVDLRLVLEQLEEDQENERSLDEDLVHEISFRKVAYQAMFNAYFQKHPDDAWQRFYDAYTAPIPSIDYTDPHHVGVWVMVEGGKQSYYDTCEKHNSILVGAAKEVGLFKIIDDDDSILRLTTILVEIQNIAKQYPDDGGDQNALREERVREYGRRWNIGDKLVSTLISYFEKYYPYANE